MRERAPRVDPPSATPAAGADRLDVALVVRGLVASRARARDLIRRGKVQVDGREVWRPATPVGAGALIAVDEHAAGEVSRGAAKLAAALDRLGFDPTGLVCLDLGASTGGFTSVLVERGAGRVHAVDVGHGQLAPRVASDPRVVVHERTDARALDRAVIPEPVGAIVADVSFISLVKALPAALALAAPGCWLVALVKPQFEVGRAAVGKGGIVRDEAAQTAAVDGVARWLAEAAGWTIVGRLESPIRGGGGNREWLIGARRT